MYGQRLFIDGTARSFAYRGRWIREEGDTTVTAEVVSSVNLFAAVWTVGRLHRVQYTGALLQLRQEPTELRSVRDRPYSNVSRVSLRGILLNRDWSALGDALRRHLHN